MKREAMRTRLMQCLRADEGFSLVEMLVAIFVIAIGLMALLSTLTASAASLVDQRARTGATRVAGEHMESLREIGFDQLKANMAAGVYTTPSTKAMDGRTYTITTTVTERDAETGNAPVAGRETVMLVRSALAWTAGTTPRAVTYDTAVARNPLTAAAVGTGGCTAGADQSIESINIVPSPATVSASGAPLQPFTATVKLCGFLQTALVQLTFVSEGLGLQFETLSSADGGITWTATIPISKVRKTVPEGKTDTLDFVLNAGPLTQQHAVDLTGQSSVPLSIDTTSISVNPIRVESTTNNCGGNKCRNRDAVTFMATTTGLNPAVDALKLKYQLQDGTFREIAMTFDSVNSRWTHTDPAFTVKYKTGSNQQFTFTASRLEPLATRAVIMTRAVNAT